MKNIILFLCIAFLCSCSSKVENKTAFPASKIEIKEGRYNVAFLIMDGVYNTELTAPFDIFQHTIFRDSIKAMNTFMIAKTMDVVTSFGTSFRHRSRGPGVD